MLKHLLIWLYNAPSGSRFSWTNYSPFPNILLFTSYAAFKRQGFFTALNPTLKYIMSAYQEANTMKRVGGDASPKCRSWCGENPNRDRGRRPDPRLSMYSPCKLGAGGMQCTPSPARNKARLLPAVAHGSHWGSGDHRT